MSKVNEIRRKASDAVRGRQYDRAIELYLKICQVEPTNGTPRNELGDLYLKTGNTVDAVESFSLSARLYSDFGLTNNAVAVFKKILRHDPNHLDSLWGLAEIRREQGMDADASTGFLDYLSRAEQVPEAGREDFYKRASELLKTMADDLEILSRLEEIYRAADRGDDVARVLIAKASQAHLEGEFEVRDRYIQHAREACEILDSLPAYHEYQDIVDPVQYSEEDETAGDGLRQRHRTLFRSGSCSSHLARALIRRCFWARSIQSVPARSAYRYSKIRFRVGFAKPLRADPMECLLVNGESVSRCVGFA